MCVLASELKIGLCVVLGLKLAPCTFSSPRIYQYSTSTLSTTPGTYVCNDHCCCCCYCCFCCCCCCLPLQCGRLVATRAALSTSRLLSVATVGTSSPVPAVGGASSGRCDLHFMMMSLMSCPIRWLGLKPRPSPCVATAQRSLLWTGVPL